MDLMIGLYYEIEFNDSVDYFDNELLNTFCMIIIVR